MSKIHLIPLDLHRWR